MPGAKTARSAKKTTKTAAKQKKLSVTEMAERFEKVPTASLFDVMERKGMAPAASVLALDIAPLTPGRQLAGTAFTWRWVRDPRGFREWNPSYLRGLSTYFSPIQEGNVVVVDGGRDRSCGHWGEMLSTLARRFGARGAIIDGGTRDSAGIRAMDNWLAYSRYTTPVEGVGRMRIHDIQVPLTLDGALTPNVTVRPGDWIVADDDAVLVIPADRAEELLIAGEELEDLDRQSARAFAAGDDIDETFRKFGRG